MLNERIDYKILNGISYAEDSRRHRELRQMIKKQGSTFQAVV